MSFLGELFGPRTLDQRFPSIAAMERAAKRRTPKFAYDYMSGGIGAEEGLARNLSDLARVMFLPRLLADPGAPVLETEILGQNVAAPFAPGPVGLTGLMWPDAPIHIARGAAAHGLPSGLSSVATNSIEEVRFLDSIVSVQADSVAVKSAEFIGGGGGTCPIPPSPIPPIPSPAL